MKLKQFLALFIVVVLVFGLAGCTEAVSYEDDPKDEAPLSIYLCPCHYRIENYINKYNSLIPKENRKIKVTIFSNAEEEAMYDQLLNELSVGDGPDIIFMDEWTNQFIDIKKLAEKNVFADMDILIEKDGEFDFSEYNALILDAGIFHGKRVMMPISYKVDYMLSAKECFDRNNLDIPDELTMDTYLDLIETYHQAHPQKPALLGIKPMYLLAEYIDMGQPIEKSSELKRLFDVLKEEDSRLKENPMYRDSYMSWVNYWPKSPKSRYNDPLIGYLGFFVENNLLFKLTWGLSYFELFKDYNIIHHSGGNAIIFEQPHVGESLNKAYAEEFFAININSKHKNEAFDFVKYMMSKEAITNKMLSSPYPISLEGYTIVKEDLLDGYKHFAEPPITDEVQLPQEIVNQITGYVENAETCEFIGQLQYVYHNILNQSIEDYYNNLITYDKMIDEMNNKLSIYFTE